MAITSHLYFHSRRMARTNTEPGVLEGLENKLTTVEDLEGWDSDWCGTTYKSDSPYSAVENDM